MLTTVKHPRIPEHRQLTRLQVYVVASSIWPSLRHALLNRRHPASPGLMAQKPQSTGNGLPDKKIESGRPTGLGDDRLVHAPIAETAPRR